MKNYIEQWKHLIVEEFEEQNGKQHLNEYENDRYDRTINRWYGRGASSTRDPSHVDWNMNRDKDNARRFLKRFSDRFVIMNDKKKFLVITKKDDMPESYAWADYISKTVPFKTSQSANKFIGMFGDLKCHNEGSTHREETLGTANVQVKPVSQIHTTDLEEFKESNECVTENNDIPGKRYDWIKDFQFTDSVINDLKQRNLFKLGTSIMALVPVNREDSPNYHQKGDGVIDDDGNIRKYDKETKEFKQVPPDRHDLEPYDILHIDLKVDTKEKKIGIDRYYGHRKDWTLENHTSTHRDWTDIPVLTKETVNSLINAYRERGVCEKLKNTIDEYIQKSVQQEVDLRGKPSSLFRDWISDNPDDETKFKRADKRQMYKDKSTDPRFVKWLQRFIDRYSNDIYVRDLRNLCEEIENGNIFNYEYDFFEPEIPSEEFIKAKRERHEDAAEIITRQIRDFYSTTTNTGD